MWIATKPFFYRGHQYTKGEQVPAEKWASKNALLKLRRIRFVDTSVQAPEPEPPKPETMNRGDLNLYATSQGLADAEGYKNKPELLEALKALLEKKTEEEGEEGENPPVDTSGATPPVTDDSTDEPEDDLFADTSDDTSGSEETA